MEAGVPLRGPGSPPWCISPETDSEDPASGRTRAPGTEPGGTPGSEHGAP